MIDPARTSRREPRLSFGSVAAAYDRGQPSYPREAVEWLLGPRPVSVLELGAGTGKLTETLVELGHDVFATDPDEKMLDVLSARLPEVRATVGTAEQIPVPDASYDVVVAAHSFHWFDLDRALPEIARVLKPSGQVALIWNLRDQRIPWVRRLSRLLDHLDSTDGALVRELDDSGMVSAIEERSFRHWHVVNVDTIQDLARSTSDLAVLDSGEQEKRVSEILGFYDDYGRGMDGMQVPYYATCYRASVLPHVQPVHQPEAPLPAHVPLVTTSMEPDDSPDDFDGIARTFTDTAQHRAVTDTADRLPRVIADMAPIRDSRTGRPDDDGPDPEMILIDFH